MKKILIVIGILSAVILSTIGIIILMFNIEPIGASETEIKDDCEKAILVAQYNSNTDNQKMDFKSAITFIETNFDSILDFRNLLV